MPVFSAFTPFGMLRFSSRKPRAQRVYEQMIGNYGPDVGSKTGHIGAHTYAQSMGIASLQFAGDRARNQIVPSKTTDLQADLEREMLYTPALGATDATRRAELADLMTIKPAGTLAAVQAALTAALGSDFVSIKQLKAVGENQNVSEPSAPGVYPAWLQPWSEAIFVGTARSNTDYPANAPVYRYSLTCYGKSGTDPLFSYTALDAGAPDLLNNQSILIAPEADQVAHATVSTTGPSSFLAVRDWDTGIYTVGKTYIGVVGVYNNHVSWHHHILIYVRNGMASDSALRTKVNRLMRTYAQYGTSWDIAHYADPAVTTPGNAGGGKFMVVSSSGSASAPLARIGTTPIIGMRGYDARGGNGGTVDDWTFGVCPNNSGAYYGLPLVVCGRNGNLLTGLLGQTTWSPTASQAGAGAVVITATDGLTGTLTLKPPFYIYGRFFLSATAAATNSILRLVASSITDWDFRKSSAVWYSSASGGYVTTTYGTTIAANAWHTIELQVAEDGTVILYIDNTVWATWSPSGPNLPWTDLTAKPVAMTILLNPTGGARISAFGVMSNYDYLTSFINRLNQLRNWLVAL